MRFSYISTAVAPLLAMAAAQTITEAPVSTSSPDASALASISAQISDAFTAAGIDSLLAGLSALPSDFEVSGFQRFTDVGQASSFAATATNAGALSSALTESGAFETDGPIYATGVYASIASAVASGFLNSNDTVGTTGGVPSATNGTSSVSSTAGGPAPTQSGEDEEDAASVRVVSMFGVVGLAGVAAMALI